MVVTAQKSRSVLVGGDFRVRRDHRPLLGRFKNTWHSIENQDLHDLVAQLSDNSYFGKYVPKSSNEFLDWVPRTSADEIYNHQSHRVNDEKSVEVLYRGNWKNFVTA